MQIPEDVKEAKVVSAFPLTPDQKKRIISQLKSILGFSLNLEEAVDPDIVAGLSIHIGHLVIDGSFAFKLREAAQHAQNATE